MPGPCAWLASGRAALRWLVEGRFGRGARVLVPAYLCASVVQALREAGADCAFFPVDARLEADWEALDRLARRSDPEVLLLIHYFGRLQDASGLAAFRARHPRVSVIEDISHSLLNTPGRRGLARLADYACGSLRKLLPVPEGGVVIDLRGAGLPATPVSPGAPSPAAVSRLAAAALERQRRLGLPLPLGATAALFERAESQLDAGEAPAAPSAPTRALLARLPTAALRARRRANWTLLAEGLAGAPGVRPLHGSLVPGWAPLGFVLRCRNRHDLWRGLACRGIGATVHWPLPPESAAAAGREARLAAGTLLTLPCDHRYGPAAMDRVVRAVRQALGAPGTR